SQAFSLLGCIRAGFRLPVRAPKNSKNSLALSSSRESAVGSEGAAWRMARVTVEDCLEQEENRFALVVLAASRTRQIMKGAHALVNAKNKPAVLSLREIAAGRVRFHRDSAEVVNEYIGELHSAQGY